MRALDSCVCNCNELVRLKNSNLHQDNDKSRQCGTVNIKVFWTFCVYFIVPSLSMVPAVNSFGLGTFSNLKL